MIIEDVINLAKYSELSSIAVKDDINALVAFINLGLLELYKRFPIKVEEHIITLETGTDMYKMPSDYMYHTAVYGEAEDNDQADNVLSVNDEDDPYSVFFVGWNVMQVPSAVTGSYVSVLYVSKPERVTVETATDGTTELDLPETLVDALLSYMGYRGHLGLRGDAQAENNAHWKRFERDCDKAAELGVVVPSDTMNTPDRLYKRGFE